MAEPQNFKEHSDKSEELGESFKGNGGSLESMEFGSQEIESESVEDQSQNSKENPFQELSIQWLNMAKVKKHFRESIKTSQSKSDSCKIIIEKIIEAYNNPKEKQKWVRIYELERTWDETDYFMRSFSCNIEFKSTNLGKAVAIKAHAKKTAYYILFYFRKDTTQIIALSSDRAFLVVKPYIDYTFPFKMAKEVADFDQILTLDRSSIVGRGLKESLIKPTKLDLCKISNFYCLIDHLTCTIDKSSCLSKIIPEQNIAIKFSSSGLLRIHKKLNLKGYLPILDLFEKYMYESANVMDDRKETKNRAFEFLYHIQPSRFFKEELDSALAEAIFEQHQQRKKLQYHVHHKYLEDFLLSNDVEIKIGTNHFKQLARKPEIEDIVKIINAENKETFKKKIFEGKLRFTDRRSATQTEAIIDCIEGQLHHPGGGSCFKIRKMWYEVKAEYLSLLNEDFRAVLQKALIRDGEDNGQLERNWKKNDPNKGQISQKILENELNFTGKEAGNLMSQLTESKVCYVSVKEHINHQILSGDILKVSEIQKHKDTIEQILGDPEILKKPQNVRSKITGKCGEDTKKIYAELVKKRSVLKRTNRGTYVLHPFPYTLKEASYYGQLFRLLVKLYELRLKEEEDCNKLPKRKKDKSKGQLTQQLLENELNLAENEASKLMSELEKLKVSYVSTEYCINQRKLLGEILNYSAIENNRDSIEQILHDPESRWNLKSQIQGVCKQNAIKVLVALKKRRNVLIENDQRMYVCNPFPYPLKEMPKYGSLSQLLVELYVPRFKEEETYNRLYIEDIDKGYLVFDQILPLHIEPCDILKYTDNTVYLYHVKAKFGQETREVCSQILNAATLFRNALSMRQSKNYLQNLYETSVNRNTSGNSWFDGVKNEMMRLGEDGFMEIFRSNRKIVFVYAYVYVSELSNKSFHDELEKPSYITRKMLGSGDERLGKKRRELLQQLGCLDPTGAGRLTNYFYSLTKEKFKETAKTACLSLEDTTEIYDLLESAKSLSDSTLAKMEVVRLAQNLASLGFDFKICEIGREIED